jgi:hypothetical protein
MKGGRSVTDAVNRISAYLQGNISRDCVSWMIPENRNLSYNKIVIGNQMRDMKRALHLASR